MSQRRDSGIFFLKVQAQVRLTKTGFDKLKNDVCQKVDLLGASRCNLLSYVLTNYQVCRSLSSLSRLCYTAANQCQSVHLCSAFQTTLLHFWEKTSHTMAAIHESFKGCQPHELSAQKVRESTTSLLNKNNDVLARKNANNARSSSVTSNRSTCMYGVFTVTTRSVVKM